MTKRLFLTNSAAGYTPATIRGSWNDAGLLTARRMSGGRNIPAAQANSARAEAVTTTPYRVLLARFVSDPVTVAQTLSGAFSLVTAFLESDAAADMVASIFIYVTTGSTDTVRGTALAQYSTSAEFGVAATGVSMSGTLSSVAMSVGDRVVIEIGYSAANTVATSYTGTLVMGGTVDADMVAGDTGANSNRMGWLEFAALTDSTFGTIVTPTGVASGQAMGAPTVKGQYTLKPAAIASAEVVPRANVVRIVKPVAIASALAFGSTIVKGMWYLRGRGIPSQEAFGQEAAVFLRGVVGKVLSREAVGTPRLLPVQVLQPKSVTSSEDVSPVMYIQPERQTLEEA